MFGELLESRARPVRNRTGTIVSVVGHGAFIALAVLATRTQLSATGPKERVIDLPLVHPRAPTSVETPSPRRSSAPQTSAPAQPTLVVPTVVLPGIPPIDLTATTPTEISWAPDASSRQLTSGVPGRGTSEDGIPFAPGVDKPAIAMAGNPSPRYPEVLRRANVTGEVVVQVVIDTTGVADMSTMRVISSSHPMLTEAVRAAFPRARFIPAETGGRKVRMWVVQSFLFEIWR